ncbi:sensor histidine kinase [Actinoplanes couchii]|uniref:histidine kinase n=1 Tax=Actinoplanes couchii TaxID=403638 RepID=A0ABQ3XNI1_9ACTN|nr:HAMP domain-containing sensor histidine kinase [Actinoplanes couchii]MDR6319705.1 signal transduction histidine kinase [Actinoplanes couchii]GID60074.1 hypothetical protein Aco03nite_084780 [Actinoplanes couchii]
MSRRIPRSTRARTTVAATAAAAICFGAGALWLRDELYANSFQASVVQTASRVNDLAVAHASGSDERMAAFEGARWIAVDLGDRIRATDVNRRATDTSAPVVTPDPLLQQVNPVRLGSGLRGPKNGITWSTATVDGVERTFVVGYVWTGTDGRTLLEPPVVDGPDGSRSYDPAVEPSRVAYYVLVPTDGAEAATGAVDPLLGVALPLSMALIAGVAWFSVGRALKPVEAISAELAAITSANLDRRVPVPDTGDEITVLAETTNATLDRLEDAVTRQRRFVADAAHELRTPLAALRNTAEVARAATASADLDVVLSSALRLQDLTDDLLLLARLDRAETRPPAAVDLAAIVEEQVAERQYRRTAGPEFTAELTGPAMVDGDRRQLERLLRNLLDNAGRHANATVTVTVAAAGDRVTVEVLDDGAGIAPEDRERIFQPFTRLDDARARDSGGTGLGLAIARTITAAHHGSLEVGDAPGGRFVLHLPAR